MFRHTYRYYWKLTMTIPVAETSKPMLSQISELIAALSSFTWPMLAGLLLYLLRNRLPEFLSLALKRIEGATDIEIGSVKLKGAIITREGEVIRDAGTTIEFSRAGEETLKKRSDRYESTRFIHIVHTIRPAEPAKYVAHLRVFDVSIFAVAHKDQGNIDDVKSISYYFGAKWGRGDLGSIFEIFDSKEGFALTAQMYGSCLCMATVEFKDGEKIEIYRYLDVEMAPIYGVPMREAR